MAIIGYLEIPDVQGEAKGSAHRGQIEIHGIAWIVQQAAAATVGSGRRAGRSQAGPVTVYKFYDASSPYLALCAMNGRALPEVRLYFEAASDAHRDYLKVRLRNCLVSGYEMLAPEAAGEVPGRSARSRRADAERIRERLSFGFERIGIVYTGQAADGSAGDEHEIEYDVVAGA
jgi:type VI secretion system secreted protein Hcp